MAEATASATAEILISAVEAAALPAFLEGDKKGGYELPKGYKAVNLQPQRKQVIRLSSMPGSEMVIYAGKVGCILKRGAGGDVYFRLIGLDLPENIFPYKGNSGYVSLTNIGGDGIRLDKDRQCVQIYQTSNSRAITGVGSWEKVSLGLPADDFEIDGGKRLGDLGLGVLGPIFHIERGNITIQSPDGLRIAVPEATAGFDDISETTPLISRPLLV